MKSDFCTTILKENHGLTLVNHWLRNSRFTQK